MRKKAFSLIELVMIVVIMSILTAVIIPNILPLLDDSKDVKTNSDLRHIASIIRNMKAKYGKWPLEMSQVPESLVSHNERLDPWGNAYSIWNYKLVCEDHTGSNIRARSSVQFRNSRLYVIGYSGTTGYVLCSTDGGENFVTLVEKANCDFSFRRPGHFEYYKNYIVMITKTGSKIYLFDMNSNELIDTTTVGKAMSSPEGIWIADTVNNIVYKTKNGIDKKFSIPVTAFNSFCGSFLNYIVWNDNGVYQMRDASTGKYIATLDYMPYDYVMSNNVFFLENSALWKLNDISHPELKASWRYIIYTPGDDAWFFGDTVIYHKTFLSSSYMITYDLGGTWSNWGDGANHPVNGNILNSIIWINDEQWLVVNSGGTYKLWYSPDNGNTWRDGPENPSNPGQTFTLPANMTITGIYYTE